MSQLVAYYDEIPVDLKGKAEIYQEPLSAARGSASLDGGVRPKLVYVNAPKAAGSVLIPFGQYDEWSLRDRYNEALRIMSALGAATITCETFGEATVRRGFRARVRGSGSAEVGLRRIENSGFDYRHVGTGSAPRDPRPLRWPDEPGFAAAVNNVLENGATEVEITIRSLRTHAADGRLGVQLTELGFDLGAQSERSDATSLHINASFPQGRKGWRQ